jgi:hypothetical protein
MENFFKLGDLVYTPQYKPVIINEFEFVGGVCIYYTSDGSSYSENQLTNREYELNKRMSDFVFDIVTSDDTIKTESDLSKKLDEKVKDDPEGLIKVLCPSLLTMTDEEKNKEFEKVYRNSGLYDLLEPSSDKNEDMGLMEMLMFIELFKNGMMDDKI